MILTCDIGNTNIKSGLFLRNTLSEFCIFSKPEEFADYASGKNIQSVVISSVVPAKAKKIFELLHSDIIVKEITHSSPANLKINYDTPSTLGIDRLCSCEGAFYLYKNSQDFSKYNPATTILTIDLGTATTINYISYPGVFDGGIIAPGINLMNNALNSGTAKLPLINTSNYVAAIGKSTEQSIASGLINSTVGLIDRAVMYLKKLNPQADIHVYVTGGNAEKILPFLEFNFTYEKALVLYGIKALSDLIL